MRERAPSEGITSGFLTGMRPVQDLKVTAYLTTLKKICYMFLYMRANFYKVFDQSGVTKKEDKMSRE